MADRCGCLASRDNQRRGVLQIGAPFLLTLNMRIYYCYKCKNAHVPRQGMVCDGCLTRPRPSPQQHHLKAKTKLKILVLYQFEIGCFDKVAKAVNKPKGVIYRLLNEFNCFDKTIDPPTRQSFETPDWRYMNESELYHSFKAPQYQYQGLESERPAA